MKEKLQFPVEVTAPGGGYSVADYMTREKLAEISDGTNMTFSLLMADYISFLARDMDYMPANDTGNRLLFIEGADKNLSGKTINWTFPAALNMDGSTALPENKSTSEQLAQGVPYVELVSSDGNITGINYKLVNSQTLEAVEPSYRTDMNLIVERKNTYPLESDWNENKNSGVWTLEEAVAFSELENISVELRSYESSTNPCVYQWIFQTVSQDINIPPVSPDITPVSPDLPSSLSGSGGGCNLGFSFAGFAILLLLKKR